MSVIHLVEPSRGMNILNFGIDIQTKYGWIGDLAPVFADIFVVIYPIFLVLLYIYAIIKKKNLLKQGALFVFFSTFFAILINILIQMFFYKERPIVVLNQINTGETLLHEVLPVSSFPSDHAVVSMCFAVSTLLWGIYNKKKFFTISGVVLIIVSLVMTISRILTLVHWPSDIVAGIGLGIIVPLLLMFRHVRYFLLRYLINPIIRFEQFLLKKIFHYDQGNV